MLRIVFYTCSLPTLSPQKVHTYLFFISLIFVVNISFGQQVQEPPPKDPPTTIRPYGYFRLDSLGDSRKILDFPNDATLAYPAPIKHDPDGRDIFAQAHYHLTYVENILGIIFQPIPWGSHLSIMGLIEGGFSGRSFFDIGAYSIRQCYGELLWETGSFLFGQFWHPLIIVDCAPQVISFNGGIPISLLSRNPQLRITQSWGPYQLLFACISQRDFKSPGPFGFLTKYIRDAIVPNLHLQFRYDQEDFFMGVGLDYKRLVPRLETDKHIKVNEQVNSVIAQIFSTYIYNYGDICGKIIYAQNGADLFTISGYGVSTIDPVTDFRTYTPTQALAGWIDATYQLTEYIELGIFAGYIKNLGALDTLVIDPKTKQPIIYSFLDVSKNVDYTARVSPRCVYRNEPFEVATELECTTTSWGKPDRSGRVPNGTPATNIRLILDLTYLF